MTMTERVQRNILNRKKHFKELVYLYVGREEYDELCHIEDFRPLVNDWRSDCFLGLKIIQVFEKNHFNITGETK